MIDVECRGRPWRMSLTGLFSILLVSDGEEGKRSGPGRLEGGGGVKFVDRGE